MRIDQRKKWYQKIKYNKNFKIVSFITIILVCFVGYMMITGKNRVGEETDDNNDGNSVETIVIEAPDDPVGDLKQYVEADTDSTEIAEYDYTIQGAGTVASKKKEDKDRPVPTEPAGAAAMADRQSLYPVWRTVSGSS